MVCHCLSLDTSWHNNLTREYRSIMLHPYQPGKGHARRRPQQLDELVAPCSGNRLPEGTKTRQKQKDSKLCTTPSIFCLEMFDGWCEMITNWRLGKCWWCIYYICWCSMFDDVWAYCKPYLWMAETCVCQTLEIDEAMSILSKHPWQPQHTGQCRGKWSAFLTQRRKEYWPTEKSLKNHPWSWEILSYFCMILLDALAILTYIMARLCSFLHTLHFRSRYRFLRQVDLLPSLHFEIGLWPNDWPVDLTDKTHDSFEEHHLLLLAKQKHPAGKNMHESKETNQKAGTMPSMDCDYDYATTIYYSQGHWVIHVILNFESLAWNTDSDPHFLSPHGTNGFESMPDKVK